MLKLQALQAFYQRFSGSCTVIQGRIDPKALKTAAQQTQVILNELSGTDVYGRIEHSRVHLKAYITGRQREIQLTPGPEKRRFNQTQAKLSVEIDHPNYYVNIPSEVNNRHRQAVEALAQTAHQLFKTNAVLQSIGFKPDDIYVNRPGPCLSD